MDASGTEKQEPGRGPARGNTAQLERHLDAIEQITHIGTWAWDVRSNVVTWSDELYRIYGLEPQSVPIDLESFLARVHPEDRARTLELVGNAMTNGQPFEYSERILRPDGSVRELETKGDVVRENGEVTMLL